jgi:hypothetical protein
MSSTCNSEQLADKYLPIYQFSERHELAPIDAAPAAIIEAIKNYDDRQDRVLNRLLAMREYPGRLLSQLGLSNALSRRERFGFKDFLLIAENDKEIIFGLCGYFWRLDYGLIALKKDTDFKETQSKAAKLLLIFSVMPDRTGLWKLKTETRIWCPDKKAIALFSIYWVVIRLASGWIRKRILKQIQFASENSR